MRTHLAAGIMDVRAGRASDPGSYDPLSSYDPLGSDAPVGWWHSSVAVVENGKHPATSRISSRWGCFRNKHSTQIVQIHVILAEVSFISAILFLLCRVQQQQQRKGVVVDQARNPGIVCAIHCRDVFGTG